MGNTTIDLNRVSINAPVPVLLAAYAEACKLGYYSQCTAFAAEIASRQQNASTRTDAQGQLTRRR